MAMSSYEVVRRAIAFETPDRLPVQFSSLGVTDFAGVARAVRQAEEQLGAGEAAVSAAGHYAIVPISEIDPSAWLRMLRVYLGGLAAITRAVLPGMVQRGSGTIVAVTSELAIGGGDSDSHYASAKGAVIGFVRSLAAEVAPQGVRINAVAPGPTDTPLLAADSPCVSMWIPPSACPAAC